MKAHWYDKNCRDCPRLAAFLDQVAAQHPHYFCRPVPPFGDTRARLLIVGLAPGMHGANASGRPFTGDYAGILLYETLYRHHFSSTAESGSAADGLRLNDCRITNAVKCLPPGNKPTTEEINRCNRFLAAELADMPTGSVVLALGGIAHKAVLKALQLKPSTYPFGHGTEYRQPALTLLSSYHCSRYNTQTGRLDAAMFDRVFQRARELLPL